MKNQCTEEDCGRDAFGRGLCSRHYQLARYQGRLPDAPEPRCCDHCDGVFTPGKWGARYCSRRCNEGARYARSRKAVYHAENCDHCGKPLPPERDTRVRFCNNKCGQDFRNAATATELRARKLAQSRICRGCGSAIPAELKSSALYCSRECKIRSRRQEAYGLTSEELRKLLEQHSVCAICHRDDWGKNGPQIDHDHATGAVRGVLCIGCNAGLGQFGDDPARLRAAVAYLER